MALESFFRSGFIDGWHGTKNSSLYKKNKNYKSGYDQGNKHRNNANSEIKIFIKNIGRKNKK